MNTTLTTALPLQSLTDLTDFVEAFESKTLPRERWTHQAHLVVALWYLVNFSEAEALAKVREGIRAYNQAVGVENTPTSGYHETLTRFWLWAVESFLSDHASVLSIHDLAQVLLNSPYADRSLPWNYYTQPHLMSHEARMDWVKPDVRALSIKNGTPPKSNVL